MPESATGLQRVLRHQLGVLDSDDVDVDGLIDYIANQGEGSVA